MESDRRPIASPHGMKKKYFLTVERFLYRICAFVILWSYRLVSTYFGMSSFGMKMISRVKNPRQPFSKRVFFRKKTSWQSGSQEIIPQRKNAVIRSTASRRISSSRTSKELGSISQPVDSMKPKSILGASEISSWHPDIPITQKESSCRPMM